MTCLACAPRGHATPIGDTDLVLCPFNPDAKMHTGQPCQVSLSSKRVVRDQLRARVEKVEAAYQAALSAEYERCYWEAAVGGESKRG